MMKIGASIDGKFGGAWRNALCVGNPSETTVHAAYVDDSTGEIAYEYDCPPTNFATFSTSPFPCVFDPNATNGFVRGSIVRIVKPISGLPTEPHPVLVKDVNGDGTVNVYLIDPDPTHLDSGGARLMVLHPNMPIGLPSITGPSWMPGLT